MVAFVLVLLGITLGTLSHASDTYTANRPYDIMGIGLSEIDIITFVDDDYIKRHLTVPYTIQKGSLSFIDRETWTTLKDNLKEYTSTPSGEVASLLFVYASLGGKATFSTVLADDEYGKQFLNTLDTLDIKVTNKPTTFDHEAMTNLIYVTPDGVATHVLINRHGAKISQNDIKYHHIKDYKMIVAEASLWDGMAQSKVILRAFKTAERVGTKRVLMLSDPLFAKKYKEDFLNLIGQMDVVMTNDQSILELMSTKDFDTMLAEISKLNTLIVVTRGAQGAVAVRGKEIYYIDASNAESGKIIDKTGSHAAFSAGFLYGYVHGKSIEESGKLAASAASYIIRQVGRNPQSNLSKILYEYSNN